MNDMTLIEAMKEAGYWFDSFESYGDYLLFRGDYGTRMTFESWEEVEDWLRGVVFDDPSVADRVWHIMHRAW